MQLYFMLIGLFLLVLRFRLFGILFSYAEINAGIRFLRVVEG